MQTNGKFEKFLSTLTPERDEIVGGLRKRIYALEKYEGALRLDGLEFTPGERDGQTYLHCKINDVDIHLRDGVQIVDDKVTGRIEIRMRKWHRADETGVCNYGYHMNVFPSTTPGTNLVLVHDTDADYYPGRPDAHMIGDIGMYDETVYATVSLDRKRNQHIAVFDESQYVEIPVQSARRPRRARANQPTISEDEYLAGRKPRQEKQDRMGTMNVLSDLAQKFS